MKITRTINGSAVEIELTAQEMREAYEEQHHNYDCDDVRTLFDSFEDDVLIEDYGFDRAGLEPYVEEIADEMRRMIYKYDVDWDYARETAASEIMSQYAPEFA